MPTKRRPRVAVRGPGAAHDPIRIVPVYLPEVTPQPSPAVAALPTAKLTYRNGPLLTAVEVFTIFWGTSWQQTAQQGLMTQLNRFFDFILTSSLIDQLAEYNVKGKAIGHGRPTGTVILTSPRLATVVTDSAIQQMLLQQIAAKKLPKATANTLYFLYLPSGVRVVMGGSASCQAFCGYHNAIGGTTYYAVMPYPGCNGCTGNLGAFDALTSTSSHELCEAITDPIPGEGWYDDANGEIGDICAWKTKKVGSYTVQLEWSNHQKRCL